MQAAGVAGTVILQGIRTANQKWTPESAAPLAEDPGKYMIRKAKAALPEAARSHIPQGAETALSKLLPLGYGMTFGALYSVLRPEAKRPLAEGLGLGLLTWAVGWLV